MVFGEDLEEERLCGLNVWKCLVWGGTLMHPAQTYRQKLERTNQVDGHAGPVH